MNILVCMSYPRAVANILPALLELCRSHTLSYFQYRKMASHAEFGGAGTDTRPAMLEALSRAGALNLGEVTQAHSVKLDTYSADFKRAIANRDFDLAIFDENVGKLGWGSPLIYRILRSQNVPVVGCQEGCVENDAPGLMRQALNLGIAYDYTLCIGKYDRECLLAHNPNLEGRLFTMGLPSNDAIKGASRGNEGDGHILLVPSWTLLSGNKGRFSPMTDEVIKASGIFELAARTGLHIVIKEKSKATREYAFKHLEREGLSVTMDESSIDDLIARSRYVIGAPSTLLLKPLQLGIPVAVLGEPYMGQQGVFAEFPGLTPLDRQAIFATLKQQERDGGADKRFVERAITGGTDFSCTRRFVDAVTEIGAEATPYKGPVRAPLGGKQGFMLRHPRLRATLARAWSGLKGGV